jgi:hypothetical protein
MDLRYPPWFSIYTIIDIFVNGLFTRETEWIYLKYDFDEYRIFGDSDQTGRRKYIVDIVADLPLLLN